MPSSERDTAIAIMNTQQTTCTKKGYERRNRGRGRESAGVGGGERVMFSDRKLSKS